MLQHGKKLVPIPEREEDGWEVVKCYLANDLALDSDDEKQLLRAHKETASKKINKENPERVVSKKTERSSFGSAPLPLQKNRRNCQQKTGRFRSSSFQSYQYGSKVCFSCGKEGIQLPLQSKLAFQNVN